MQAGCRHSSFNDTLTPTSSLSDWRARIEAKFAPAQICRFRFRSSSGNDSASCPLESDSDLQQLRECYARQMSTNSFSKATKMVRILVIAEEARKEDRAKTARVQTRRQRSTDMPASSAQVQSAVSGQPASRARESPSGATPASKKPRALRHQ